MTNQEHRSIGKIEGLTEKELNMVLVLFRMESLVEDVREGMSEYELVSKYKVPSRRINDLLDNISKHGPEAIKRMKEVLSRMRSPEGCVIVDIETNVNGDGTDVSPTEPYWIGAVMVKRMKIVGKFERLVSVSRPLTKFSSDLTGMTQDRLDESSAPLKDVFEDFFKWKKDVQYFASWTTYDWNVLRKRATELGFEWPFAGHIDVKRPFRESTTRTGLSTVLEYLGLMPKDCHSAIRDAEMVFEVIEQVEKVALGMGLWRRIRDAK